MNDACNIPVSKNTKKVSDTRPNVPKNKATVGSISVSNLENINPSATPVKVYTKKTK